MIPRCDEKGGVGGVGRDCDVAVSTVDAVKRCCWLLGGSVFADVVVGPTENEICRREQGS